LVKVDGLMETVYLLRFPTNAEHLNKSIAQYKAGKVPSGS